MIAGFAAPLIVYAAVTLLHLALPARRVEGYAIDPRTQRRHRYRLNGLVVYLAIVAIWALLCARGLIAWDFFWATRWQGLAGACTLGLLFTLCVVLTAPSTGKSLLADLYLGRIENPQWLGGRIDAKMSLYLWAPRCSASTSIRSRCTIAARFRAILHRASRFTRRSSASSSCEYLFFERVHLYTYDFFAERVGFKLGWGCLCFYPYFYAVGLWSVADRPNPRAATATLVGATITFCLGWSLARGANMQKYAFKRDPGAKFLGCIAPVAITDGDKKLLVSGFWRVSRHVNYLGEILMATGLTLALGYPGVWATWLYPLYYVALLVPRQMDDDRRCAEKYGPLWEEYRARVPYRIVPGVY